MQASLTAPESLADQRTIVEQVFATMAGIELTPCDEPPPPTGPVVATGLAFTAPSEGSILVECSPGLAFQFTSRLMAIQPPVGLDDDVADAMRELANMIGGNLKGLMPEETCVSIPRVLEAEELAELTRSGGRLSRICFSAGDGGEEHCAISLFENRLA